MDTGTGYDWRQRMEPKGKLQEDEKGLRKQGAYRGRGTDPRSGNAILAQSGTYVHRGQRCRSVSRTKHVWYSEHGMYCRFKIILEQAMSATHVAVIPHMRTHSDEEEFPKK